MAIHIIPHANIVTTYRVATDSREYEPLQKNKAHFWSIFLRISAQWVAAARLSIFLLNADVGIFL